MIDFSKLSKQRAELGDLIGKKDAKKLKSLLTDTFINLNYVDKDGQTPIHKACMTGSLELVRVLVEFGASQNIKNTHGWYPIHLASYYGYADIVMFMLNEDNFKKESKIDVFDDDDDKFRSCLRETVKYRHECESNEEETDESEDEYNSSDDDEEHDDNLIFEFDSTSANDLISNLNTNDLLFDLKHLELNSTDFLF